MEFAKSQRGVENGEKWRKLLVKSPVVPQRPCQLKDGLKKDHVTLWAMASDVEAEVN